MQFLSAWHQKLIDHVRQNTMLDGWFHYDIVMNMTKIQNWRLKIGSFWHVGSFKKNVNKLWHCCDISLDIYDVFVFSYVIFKSNYVVERIPIKSLWLSEAIWLHRSWSVLAQVMACCLMAPSHCLNRCWLVTQLMNKFQSHPREGSSWKIPQLSGANELKGIWIQRNV